MLSFLYLWTIKSIVKMFLMKQVVVVNCFHFCIFELSKASFDGLDINTSKLWIAFIFVSLNYQKHLVVHDLQIDWSCELLSFLYLWTIKSIIHHHQKYRGYVVNCFHFCIFELSKASHFLLRFLATMLWIAFIFVSLNYQKHLKHI